MARRDRESFRSDQKRTSQSHCCIPNTSCAVVFTLRHGWCLEAKVFASLRKAAVKIRTSTWRKVSSTSDRPHCYISRPTCAVTWEQKRFWAPRSGLYSASNQSTVRCNGLLCCPWFAQSTSGRLSAAWCSAACTSSQFRPLDRPPPPTSCQDTFPPPNTQRTGELRPSIISQSMPSLGFRPWTLGPRVSYMSSEVTKCRVPSERDCMYVRGL